jgi:hypothetical protein
MRPHCPLTSSFAEKKRFSGHHAAHPPVQIINAISNLLDGHLGSEGREVMRLRVESPDGSCANDYRIRDEFVEVRSLEATGQPVSGSLGHWRPMDRDDIALHHALGTAVSQWLQARRGDEYPLKKAA